MTASLMQPTDSAPPNPFAGLLHSRKFLLMVLDLVASAALYFVGKYYGAALDDLKFLIAALQPVIGLVIYSITEEDKARTHANAAIQVAAHEAQSAVAVAMAANAADAPSPMLAADHAPFNRTNEPLG
jgi:hypothetical protein